MKLRRLALLLAAAASGACGSGSATDVGTRPPGVSGLTATAASHTEVLLTWTPADGARAREIRIERAVVGGAFSEIAILAAGTSSYLDAGLEPGTRYRYRVRVCGEGGCSAPAEVSVTTLGVLEVVTERLPDARRGEPYSAGLEATGGAGGYFWSVQSGSLPAGLTLSETGIVSGVPTTVQVARFVVRVRSLDGQTASRELTIGVDEAPSAADVAVVTPRLPPALLGSPYEVSLAATGGEGGAFAWSVVEGALPPGLALGTNGVFSGAPSASGAFDFTVRVMRGEASDERAFMLVVVVHEPTRFQITTFEVADVPPEIRPHFAEAVARWQRVVTGDLPVVRIPQRFFSSTFCGGFGDLVNGTSVDDLIVLTDISPIDGPAGILGEAGPCGLRSSEGLPFAGVLTLDSDDLAPLVGTRTLTDIIFHEIGHVLGFGSLWESEELIVGAGTGNPRFTGARATQEFAALGGSGPVPVENTGGTGTANVHWRETVFRTEIMTGFAERVGVAMPLSRVTIASMADLGYVVDTSQADAYTLPGASGVPAPAELPLLGHDVVLRGPVRRLADPEPRP